MKDIKDEGGRCPLKVEASISQHLQDLAQRLSTILQNVLHPRTPKSISTLALHRVTSTLSTKRAVTRASTLSIEPYRSITVVFTLEKAFNLDNNDPSSEERQSDQPILLSICEAEL